MNLSNRIRTTSKGIYVIDADSHTTKWTEEQGRIDTDRMIDKIVALIPENGVVVDAGASIGDHTVPYARKVGVRGRVIAFEPNAAPFCCLTMNVRDYPQVFPMKMALANKEAELAFNIDAKNVGASEISPSGADRILAAALDDFEPWFIQFGRFDLFKIDCEGFEPKVIAGAARLIARFKPIIIMEINRPILLSHGSMAELLLEQARLFGYSIEAFTGKMDSVQFDVICRPI